MTREEAINVFEVWIERDKKMKYADRLENIEIYKMAINALKQEPCEDAISRNELLKAIDTWDKFGVDANLKIVPVKDCYVPYIHYDDVIKCIKGMPPITPQAKTGHCKECKYFEYDSVAKVDGIPLIVAHEICKRWGDGCQTREDGYCFLFEPKESEDKE